ncbi:MAG TPA: triose-phosphate isomerase [Chromatiaceae bacterium]|jgi:triosephosphate isomerase|nr:triose-phosphate isomerase [Chromatiaceae bacterium]HIN81510.1 triose-phosphate isomerase [Chromatiales bacterium]HIA07655.1 triose-phosphate isomerase [Chromatiaceae bacterium]HIB84150.1 triose-phosphate isomerase [Chromatiaceae bacterium]HIO13858.1 triose-phosphate isomerase [Chromatiales bacterium]
MRRVLVAGNWKMNGSKAANVDLITGLKAGLGDIGDTEVAVCPPFIYLSSVAEMLDGTGAAWGSQNIAVPESGAYTGETSGSMLNDFGCTYAIVGHSERRALYGETDQLVAEKYAAAHRAGIQPILCVGETLEEREGGITTEVVARQLDAVLSLEGVESLNEAVIAYEPVWAIGTGKTATGDQAQEVHAFIRSKVAEQSADVAKGVRILYGGSVKGANAAELFAMEDIDGGLIGGASLDAAEFLKICSAGS